MFGTCIIGIFNIALILMGFGVIFTAFWLTDQNVIEHYNFSLLKHRIIFPPNRCINRFSFSFHLQILKKSLFASKIQNRSTLLMMSRSHLRHSASLKPHGMLGGSRASQSIFPPSSTALLTDLPWLLRSSVVLKQNDFFEY